MLGGALPCGVSSGYLHVRNWWISVITLPFGLCFSDSKSLEGELLAEEFNDDEDLSRKEGLRLFDNNLKPTRKTCAISLNIKPFYLIS